MSISLIACVDDSLAIGKDNKLLAHIPADLARFKQLTQKQVCIMGRKTLESIISKNGEPLTHRTNIVLTKNKDYQEPNMVFKYHSIDNLLYTLKTLQDYHKHNGDSFEVMVIGGQQIYEQFLPYADTIYLTMIHHRFEDSDAFFPQFALNEWRVATTENYLADKNNPYDYSFVTYKKYNNI